MKRLAIPALALCMLVLAACAESTSPATNATITDATNKVQAKVEGMTCTGCSGQIVAAVQGIEGVSACQADPKTGEVTVALKDDADADAKTKEIESVIAGLSDGKYTVSTIAASTKEAKSCEGCDKDCGKDEDKAQGEEVVTACPADCEKDCCKKA